MASWPRDQVSKDFRGGFPLPPSPTLTGDEVVRKGGRNAEDAHKQVADGQAEDELVGDSAHVLVLEHNEADRDSGHHAEKEDEPGGHNEHGRPDE